MENEDYKSIEPSEEEIEQMKKEHKEIISLRKIHEYNRVDSMCPNCEHYPLESQTYGYERSIFCTNCSYHRTEDM